MIHYSKADFDNIDIDKNTIFSFDIETTSLKNEEIVVCYIWMLGIDGTVYYGRELDEFVYFVKLINEHYEGRKYMYIHNLSYEFHFINKYFPHKEIILMNRRKILYMRLTDLNFELRCSYLLTNTSLDKVAINLNLPIKKLKGDLDYSISRNSKTILTKEELNYCENDILIIYYAIRKYLDEYGSLAKIPRTQTGIVRRKTSKQLSDKTKGRIKRMKEREVDKYVMLRQAFMGGYVHANALHSNQIIDNVYSYDIASSYPSVMVNEKFPMSQFKDEQNFSYKEYKKNRYLDGKCYLFHVRINNMKIKGSNTYLSISRCLNKKNVQVDNGRIIAADMVEVILTDVDLDIVLSAYTADSFDYARVMSSKAKYLPPEFIEMILELYHDKTSLKGVKGQEDNYRRSKEMLNSLYGMCVTDVIKDEVLYNDEEDDIEIHELTNQMIGEKLTSEKQDITNYAWGVWITAYARLNLWRVVQSIGDDVVYCDTDSVKFIGEENKKKFDKYNENMLYYMYRDLDFRGIKYDIPKEKSMGIWEYEGKYDRFKTMGAKKYAYEKDGKLSITVSGVPKEEGAKALGCLENFREGFVFGEECGKKTIKYIDDQKPTYVTDYQGNKCLVNQKSGIHISPTTYTLSMSHDYKEYINFLCNTDRKLIWR